MVEVCRSASCFEWYLSQVWMDLLLCQLGIAIRLQTGCVDCSTTWSIPALGKNRMWLSMTSLQQLAKTCTLPCLCQAKLQTSFRSKNSEKSWVLAVGNGKMQDSLLSQHGFLDFSALGYKQILSISLRGTSLSVKPEKRSRSEMTWSGKRRHATLSLFYMCRSM